jgi:hypothetical protein
MVLPGAVFSQQNPSQQSPAQQNPAQQPSAAKKPVQHKRPVHKSAKKVEKAAPANPQASIPSGPLQGIPLDQIPSTAPLVSYQNEKLSIVSRNATLGDILRAVQKQTGAVIDMPSNSTERVVGMFGPGPSREVLASLLNGSHFNYVLLGSQADPRVLEHVILITKSGPDDVAPTVQANAAGQPAVPGQVGGQNVPQDGEAATDAADDATDDAATDDSATAVAPEDGSAQPQQPMQGVKSPEQLLQELQRQQMIQQQQQNGGGGAPQGFPQPQSPQQQ